MDRDTLDWRVIRLGFVIMSGTKSRTSNTGRIHLGPASNFAGMKM